MTESLETGGSAPGTTWRPTLVALDIDGTLVKWVTDSGASTEEVTPAVYDAVRDVVAAGSHVVLASGRSPHGLTRVADLLDLPGAAADRLWMVASNGAVVFRYPPIEIVYEVTFDARPAVLEVLEHRPEAVVAVEERGVGYRVSREFPQGELHGELIPTSVEDLIAEPVSRVIIRDPTATAEDFVELAGKLGLHGTDYVIGWTAWMDLTPVGTTKASGVAHVAEVLGVDQADTLAIGDGRNDLELLRWVGRGVAMGQATDEVREAADAVTGPVDEDGAAAELRRWFPSAAPTRSTAQPSP